MTDTPDTTPAPFTASTHGIVVDHKEANARYAISDRNFDPKVHVRVRDLKHGETVLGYKAKPLPKSTPATDAPEQDVDKTEGSATVGTKAHKK